MKNNIVLIGFMGTGKTTVGQLLTEMLGYTFVDTDDLIVEKVGMPISDIFACWGEKYFRRVEEEIIQSVMDLTHRVVSTGGGAVLNPANLQILKEKGVVINLQASPDVLWDRLKDCTDRPLLQGKNPREKLEELYTARLPIYSQAHYQVDVNHRTPLEIAHEIVQIYRSERKDHDRKSQH